MKLTTDMNRGKKSGYILTGLSEGRIFLRK